MAKRKYRSRNRGRRSRRRPVYIRRKYSRRIKQPTQYFTRSVYLPGYYSLPASGVAAGAAINFSLSQLPNVTEFTGLYDQYKIKAVKCTLIPRHTEVLAGTTNLQGNMWSVLDYDDSNVPSNLDELLQYQNIKRTRMNQTHTRYFRPMTRTILSTGYSPKRNQWIDCSDTTVEHRGVKFWFDSRLAPVTFDVQIKYYCAFKNVR